ncbi:MAG: hypothetical protein Q9172_006789 [Xanthocarpia lactea]
MAYPQRQFQQAPSNASYNARQAPYAHQRQQQHVMKQHAYYNNPQNRNHYERPFQETSFRQDRDFQEAHNFGPNYGSPQWPQQDAEWAPEAQQPYTNPADYARPTPSQMRPRQGAYQDQTDQQNYAQRPPAGTPYQQNQNTPWGTQSPQMPGYQQQFYQPSDRGLGPPPTEGYDGTSSHPRTNGYHAPGELQNSDGNYDRRYHNPPVLHDPPTPFHHQQRSWPVQDVRANNAGWGQEAADAQAKSHASSSSSGKPKKTTKERIRMDPTPAETISWDNPFPTFPKSSKKSNPPPDDELSRSMDGMGIDNRSNSREAQSNRPPNAERKIGSDSLRKDGQAFSRRKSEEKPMKANEMPLERNPARGQVAPGPQYGITPIQQSYDQTVMPPEGIRPGTDHGRYLENTTGVYAFGQPGAYLADSQRSKTMPNTISETMMDPHPPKPYGRHTSFEDGRHRLVNEQVSRGYEGPPQSQIPTAPTHPHSQPFEIASARQYPDSDQWASNPYPHHSQQSSLGDFFDSYYHSPHHSDPNFAQRHAGHSRIPPDQDMPNFDNMPETEASHRRGMTIDDHLRPQQSAAALPPMPQLPVSGRSPPIPRSQEAFARSKSSPNLQEQRTQPTQQYSDGFDFDLPGSVPAMYCPGPSPSRNNYESINTIEQPNRRPFPQNAGEHPSPVSARHVQATGRPRANESHGRQPFSRPPDRQGPPSMPRGPTSNNSQGQGLRNGPGPTGRSGPTSPPTGPQSNPDALPAHPAPVRAGLMQHAPANQPPRPPPVRQYPQGSSSQPQTSANPRPQISRPPREISEPAAVTHEGLERLRQNVRKSPSDHKMQLLLAKKLVEAASVLADEGGRADAKTASRNRERFNSEAYKLVKKLVQSGYPDAMFYFGDCYTRGFLGLESDAKEAFGQYQSAAKAGHAQAAYRVAVCCEMGLEEGGGTKRDAVKAMQWYHRAATLGDTPAMYKMGVIQLKGLLGQPKNAKAALSWLQKAAEKADKENPHALHELALLYEEPNGIEGLRKDEGHAKQLFIEAANLGYKFSQFRLGRAFEYGLLGCPIDPRQSIAWYSKAAVQDEHQSELALSGWYLTGSEGVLQQSDTEAYLWARKAAQAGLAKAEYAMGYFTEVGIGAPANLEDAKRWYWRSASQNFPKARERLEDLRRGGAKMQKTRVSRSKMNKQSEGECVVM